MTDYQLSVATTGLLLGAGTDYIVHSWDGLGLPGVRTNDRPKPYVHGAFLGPEFVDGRNVIIDVSLRGDSDTDAMSMLDALIAAWYFDATGLTAYDTSSYLTVKLPGQSIRRLYGRPRRGKIDIDRLLQGHPSASLEWWAGDPRWYSDDLHSQGMSLGSATTGRSYPRSYDFGYGGTATSGAASIVNAGNFITQPTLRLDGPLTNVTLTNETTGESLVITYTLGSGEYLLVDFAAKTVLLNGTASRYYAKSGTWWALRPGSNSIRFAASSGSGTATLSWRDAWL